MPALYLYLEPKIKIVKNLNVKQKKLLLIGLAFFIVIGSMTFVKTDYRSAYFRLQITQGSAYQVGRYLLIHDGTTATLIEESAIATGSMLGTVTAAVVSSNVIIYINMGSSSSATVTHIIDKITV